MELIIDAQIFHSYFIECNGKDSQRTGDVKPIFELLSDKDTIFFDSGGHIENEWRHLVGYEFFDGWYANMLYKGCASEIKPESCHSLKKILMTNYGFPRAKDIWYIRTAKAVSKKFKSNGIIVTEDMDFFNPKEKRATYRRRIDILLSGGGPVADHLRKQERIQIKCVAIHAKDAGFYELLIFCAY